MNIGDRIKQRRIEMGLDADDLAKRIGKSRATVYRYENGDIENMPTTVLEPIAKALNTTPADLMGWDQNVLVSATATFYNVHCETEKEAELILSYRELSDIGKKRVSKYTNCLLDTEKAEAELNAAHEDPAGATEEQKKNADDIMMDDSEWE